MKTKVIDFIMDKITLPVIVIGTALFIFCAAYLLPAAYIVDTQCNEFAAQNNAILFKCETTFSDLLRGKPSRISAFKQEASGNLTIIIK